MSDTHQLPLINKVAITGANGFIGRALVQAYKQRGAQVSALVRSFKKGQVEGWNGVNLVEGSLEDSDALERLCEGAELVIHCAAFMGKRDPELSDQVNILGTQHIVEAAVKSKVKRFIYVSSISVYRGTESPDRVFTEECFPYLHPQLNHYSRSKLEGEVLTQQLCESHGLEYVIIRPTNVYGPGCRPWGSQVERLVSRYHVCFGRVVFNFIHIDDLVSGFMLMGDQPQARNQAFNLAAEAVELSLFHRHIAQKLGVWTLRLPWVLDTVIRYAIDGVARLRGEIRSTGYTPKFVYPHEKAQRLLGYEPQHFVYPKT